MNTTVAVGELQQLQPVAQMNNPQNNIVHNNNNNVMQAYNTVKQQPIEPQQQQLYSTSIFQTTNNLKSQQQIKVQYRRRNAAGKQSRQPGVFMERGVRLQKSENYLADIQTVQPQRQQQQQQLLNHQISIEVDQSHTEPDAKRIKHLLTQPRVSGGGNSKSNRKLITTPTSHLLQQPQPCLQQVEMRSPDLGRKRQKPPYGIQAQKLYTDSVPMAAAIAVKQPTSSPSWASPLIGWSSTPSVSSNESSEMPTATAGVGSPSSSSSVASGEKDLKRRSGSFSAEQKRRFNIKMAFDRLQVILPGISSQQNAKISKASIMNKATSYIKRLLNERRTMDGEIHTLHSELDLLKGCISGLQQQLPVTGVPITQTRTENSVIKFNSYIKERTRANWKFYLFGIVIKPWFTAYDQAVVAAGHHNFQSLVLNWAEQECSLPKLRSRIVSSLQVMSSNTSVLTEPSQVRPQIEEMVEDDDTEIKTS